jgi:hypothetical protein
MESLADTSNWFLETPSVILDPVGVIDASGLMVSMN